MLNDEQRTTRRAAYLSRVALQNMMGDMIRTFGGGIVSVPKKKRLADVVKSNELKSKHHRWATTTVGSASLSGTFSAFRAKVKELRDAERKIPKLWIEVAHERTVHAAKRTLDHYRKNTPKVIVPVKTFAECGVAGRERDVRCHVLMPYAGITSELLGRMKEDHKDGLASKLLWLGVKRVGEGMFIVRTARREANTPWQTSDSYVVIDDLDVWGWHSTVLGARKDQDRARLREFKSMLRAA